jgi:WD40 repeat protein
MAVKIKKPEPRILDYMTIGSFGCLKFSSDDRYLLAVEGKKVHVFDWQARKLVKTLKHRSLDGEVIGLSFSRDSKYVLCTHRYPRKFAVWKHDKGEMIKLLSHEKDKISAAAFDHDTSSIYFGCKDGKILLQNLKSDKSVELSHEFNDEIESILPLPGSESYVAVSGDCIRVVRSVDGFSRLLYRAEEDISRTTLILSSDGKKIIFLDTCDGTLNSIDISTLKTRLLNVSIEADNSISLSRDGKYLFGTGADEAGIYNIKTGNILLDFKSEVYSQYYAALTSDSRYLAMNSAKYGNGRKNNNTRYAYLAIYDFGLPNLGLGSDDPLNDLLDRTPGVLV